MDNPSEYKYSLAFSPLSDRGSTVRFTSHGKPKDSRQVNVAVDDRVFGFRARSYYTGITADLVDISAAIFTSDRLAVQSYDKAERHIHVTLPLRCPDVFMGIGIQSRLLDLLYWATGTHWTFEFIRRKSSGRSAEGRTRILLPSTESEIALWSGGVDALAGVYTRAKDRPRLPIFLVSSGGNSSMYARQQDVFRRVNLAIGRRANLLQVPIRFHGSGRQHKNAVPRSRGVVFCLIGAVATILQGQSVLNVCENGIGAINLPYTGRLQR